MQRLNNHYIICGFGRIGKRVSHQLQAAGFPFVVIERDANLIGDIEENGVIVLRGDGAHEATLEEAGLARARTLIVTTPSDAENILITLTARQLAPAIPIVVRCDEESNSSKFLRAGATRVVTPFATGATQIALAATKPHVIDLLDLATGQGERDFEIRELAVPAGSAASGQSLRQLALGSRFGVIVIGIKPQRRTMLFNPPADAAIQSGDTLIAVGSEEKFALLEAFLAG
jgi:voltage-gated potassium channel